MAFAHRKRIAFVSTMAGSPWGGSEELWSQTALLLKEEGWDVVASVTGWPILDRRILELKSAGIEIYPRRARSLLWRFERKIKRTPYEFLTTEVEAAFKSFDPALVVISEGSNMAPVDLMEKCRARRWPFVTLSHLNYVELWPMDDAAARCRKVLPFAEKCFFVSNANLTLARKQFAYDFPGAEVVDNPIHPEARADPSHMPEIVDELRLACVGRLEPVHKGQDLLLEALAAPAWRSRRWRLAFYGDGPRRQALEHLTQKLDLQDYVEFKGHVSPRDIWDQNHVLVMPSRREGAPLTLVEAMLAGRPVITTDVGRAREMIDHGETGFIADAPDVKHLSEALEECWRRRAELPAMGARAAIAIRRRIPPDPVRIFAEKLKIINEKKISQRFIFNIEGVHLVAERCR